MNMADALTVLFIGICAGSIMTLVVQMIYENILPRWDCLL